MKGSPLQGWGCEFRLSVPWSRAASPEVQCWLWEAAAFWVFQAQGAGHLQHSAGSGAGAVCGAGAAGCWPQPLFPQLEQHPKQCVGGTDPLTSVTSCFPSLFSGKADC